MAIARSRPGPDELEAAIAALRDWQHEGAPMQLHPGDVGWHYRFGLEAMTTAVVTWCRDGRVLALGLIDPADLIRLTVSPGAAQDEELAEQVVADLVDPTRGVLPTGRVAVEVPSSTRVRALLSERGWLPDEPWTPLTFDLTRPVPDPGLRIQVVGPDEAEVRAEVQRASFDSSTFTAQRWQAMASGPAYTDARCLVAYDDEGNAVAAVTVWSAGIGRPGLIEPLGVHRDHRGHGHGVAITRAAAVALRDLGASSAIVCTPSSNTGGVATYRSAGMQERDQVRDLYRPA
jgi:ribosomal protein S18 acetylase RimI-like enzyme